MDSTQAAWIVRKRYKKKGVQEGEGLLGDRVMVVWLNCYHWKQKELLSSVIGRGSKSYVVKEKQLPKVYYSVTCVPD